VNPPTSDADLDLNYHERMHITQHFLVSGRVQGVNFRYFTRQNAIEIGLCGWVRNLSDGRVEALVCGARVDLDELQRRLERGPERAVVQNIETEVVDQQGNMKDFKITEDGVEPWVKPLQKK
jgi:acylphosphatase